MSAASTKAPVKAQPATAPAAQVPWNPWLGLAFVVVAFYVAQVVAGVVISIYPALRHWTNAQAQTWGNNSIIAQFIYVLLAESLMVGAVILLLKLYKAPPRTIGLRRPRWNDLAYGLAGLPVYLVLYLVVVFVITLIWPHLNLSQTQNIGFTTAHGAGQLILTALSLVILPPVAEEIMVRGVLYGSLKKGLPTLAAVIVTSLIFAAAHLPEGSGGLLYIGALDIFILSLVLTHLRDKTDGLYASMTLHGLKNAIAYFSLFIAPFIHIRWF